MKNYSDFLWPIFAFLAVIWLAGVQFHPEVLPEYFSKTTVVETDLYRLELVNGKTLTGKIVRKDAEGLTLNAEGVSTHFSKNEVAKLTLLPPQTTAKKFSLASKRPLVTFSIYNSPLRWLSRTPSEETDENSLSEKFFNAPWLAPGKLDRSSVHKIAATTNISSEKK